MMTHGLANFKFRDALLVYLLNAENRVYYDNL